MTHNMRHVWLIGSGGLGSAIYDALQSQGIQTTCFSRTSDHPLDIKSEAAIHALVENSIELPDTIIITPGLLHDTQHPPEKSITQVQKAWLDKSIDINVMPTLYLAKALTKRLQKHDKLTMATFSARVSSIGDNRLGGWHSYRMSKCMLNMLVKNIALEWAVKSPQSLIFGYHPGTVDTPLSKPFQKNLPKHQLFSPEKAAHYFIDCLVSRQTKHSGKLYDWQKKEVTP